MEVGIKKVYIVSQQIQMKNPLVSVIILNWNGKKWLERCLPTLLSVIYKPIEIIVVNNGSTDDSQLFLKKHFPTIKIVELKSNIGYAGANNVGVKAAKGKYLLFLNNDTEVTPDFLNTLVHDLENDSSIGAVQPQMRSLIHPELMDSVGSFFTDTGFLYYFGYMKPYNNPLYQKQLYVYSLKGACYLMRRVDFLYLGGLDEDFICYVEETDLCHRIWLNGKKVLYDPNSVMYHWGGGDMQVMTKSEINVFRSFRNRIFSYYKNFSFRVLLHVLPIHILIAEAYMFVTLITGHWKNAIAIQKGIIDGIFGLSKMKSKRQYIQHKLRKVSDEKIFPYIKRNPKPWYYYSLFAGNKFYED
jgi:GT2 family glycosyltransferase